MLKRLLQILFRRRVPGAVARQSAALPYAVVDGRVVLLLITSRKMGRWIFPKGSISQGMTAWDSAAKEAFEEAGGTGEIATVPLGTYRQSDKGVPVDVDLYPLRVDQQLEAWDEMGQRLRHWAPLAETTRLLTDRTLVKLTEALHRQLVADRVIQ